MSISVKGLPSIEASLKKLQDQVGISTALLCQDQMRLWLNDMIRFSGNDPKAKLGKQKEIAFNALWNKKLGADAKGDLAETFKTVEKFTLADIGEGFLVQFPNGTRAIARHDKILDYYEMLDFHNKQRNKRGRVQKKSETAWVKTSDFRKYARIKMLHVGTLKAGWLPAARHFAGLSGGKVKSAAWINRNAGNTGSSGYKGRINKKGTGKITSFNSVPYARKAIKKDLIIATRNMRQKALANITRGRMQQIVDQFNKASL